MEVTRKEITFWGGSKNGLNRGFDSTCLGQAEVDMLCWVYPLMDISLEDGMQRKERQLSPIGFQSWVHFVTLWLLDVPASFLHLASEALQSQREDVKESSRILTVSHSFIKLAAEEQQKRIVNIFT